jgi:hypothetical protein
MLGSTLLLASCSGKSAEPASNAESSAGAVTSLGKATFSALIDGAPVSGGAIDGMQQQNAAHNIPATGNRPAYLLFYLFDTKTPDDPHFTHSFRVYVPKQLGTAATANLTLNVILDADHAAKYNSSSPTITITSLTATRVAGTFSANMKVSPDTPNVPKQEVSVTEGKFDIPLATSNIIPP